MRSALSAVLPPREGYTFGKHPLVSRMLKGIFKLRPSLPRHTVTFDTNVVLKYISGLPPNGHLDLEFLTLKLTTLLCILSGQRCQTIGELFLKNMHSTPNKWIFYISSVLKTSRPSFHQQPLEFLSYPLDPRLCPVKCLELYVQRTSLIRENNSPEDSKLILSYAYDSFQDLGYNFVSFR